MAPRTPPFGSIWSLTRGGVLGVLGQNPQKIACGGPFPPCKLSFRGPKNAFFFACGGPFPLCKRLFRDLKLFVRSAAGEKIWFCILYKAKPPYKWHCIAPQAKKNGVFHLPKRKIALRMAAAGEKIEIYHHHIRQKYPYN